jgi:two-component system alkaline phosphatase synthesis response regulator PhoP
MASRISIFSSNKELLESTTKTFRNKGAEVVVYSTAGEAQINALYKYNPDIVLLDLDIINTDGIELCYRLTSEAALTGFVVLFSEASDDYIQIEAFKAGAHDYIVRPINPRILQRRVGALLKRKLQTAISSIPQILSYKGLKIDRSRYIINKENEELTLPRKEFEMLYLLLTNPQKVFTRKEIYKSIWQKEASSNDRIIDVHIRKIREKVGEQTIKTVKGVGYQLA